MRYQHIFAAPALATAFLLLFACGSKQTNSNAPESATAEQANTLSFRITWTDYSGRGQAIGKIVDAYNALPDGGATVQLLGGDEDEANVQTMLVQSPETVFVLPYRYVRYFGDLGYLSDLSDAFAGERSLFYPEIWALGTMNGSTYGVPWLGHSMCLLYNKTLLEQAGVDPASINSLAVLVDALERVEQQTQAKGIGLVGADGNDVSWMVNQFIYGFGGRLVDESGTQVAINSAQAASALNFYRNVLGEHAQPTWVTDTGAEVMEAFRNQQIAFEIQGIWGISDIQKNGSPFEVGVLSMKEVGLCAEVGPMMLSVPAGMSDEGREQAIEFIRYLISKDAQEQILNGEYSVERDTYYPFRTPIRIDMADMRLLQLNPVYQIFIEGFENPSVDVPVPAWQTVKSEFYEPGLHRVMTGELSIPDFLIRMEMEGNRILAAQQTNGRINDGVS